MNAVVFHDIGDIRLENVSEPQIEQPADAVVRLTASAICGTDLHMVRGTLGEMEPGTILGHEGVGIVEEFGKGVRGFNVGDRVVIGSTIACGYCAYCRSGYFSQCDNANPNGKLAGTAFFGGPKMSGPFHGLQAERARVPFANVNMLKLPEEVSDDQAILISDIFPTGWFAAKLAEIKKGDIVAVFGCGPVGQFAIASAMLLGAGRVLAVDTISSRLDMAREQGAEVIDFNEEHPVEAIRELTGGIGADRVIDCVGVDSVRPHSGPAAEEAEKRAEEFDRECKQIAPKARREGGNWHPGDAPSLALEWEVKACAKAGTLSIVGVYPENMRCFPIGSAMNKNLTLQMGNCNHRKYIPQLIEMVRMGAIDPTKVLTEVEPLASVIDAYKAFDQRQPGWIKVELLPKRMHA
jgi:threonine dehydrogenase-like Zn-dependent dehydrogenase